MLSKYAERHTKGPVCECGEPATRLMLIDGAPIWVCQEHYDIHPYCNRCGSTHAEGECQRDLHHSGDGKL